MIHQHPVSIEEIERDPKMAQELIAELEKNIMLLERRERIYRTGLAQCDISLRLVESNPRSQIGFRLSEARKLIAAALAGLDTSPRSCSICRRAHGEEIRHSAE